MGLEDIETSYGNSPQRKSGFWKKPGERTACSQYSETGQKWRSPGRLPASPLEIHFISTPTRGGRELRSALRIPRGMRDPPRAGKKSTLPPRQCARAPSCFPLAVSPAPHASFEEVGKLRARATTLPSGSSTADRRKRGRKAWRRRRRRRERRRRWRRPLASVRWRRRWWRQWTGRPGLGPLEQLLAG